MQAYVLRAFKRASGCFFCSSALGKGGGGGSGGGRGSGGGGSGGGGEVGGGGSGGGGGMRKLEGVDWTTNKQLQCGLQKHILI